MTANSAERDAPRDDTLGKFLAYADRLDSIMRSSVRPASYAETCCCGASVEVGTDVPARERMRLAQHFIARHQHCTQPRREADVDTTVTPLAVGDDR